MPIDFIKPPTPSLLLAEGEKPKPTPTPLPPPAEPTELYPGYMQEIKQLRQTQYQQAKTAQAVRKQYEAAARPVLGQGVLGRFALRPLLQPQLTEAQKQELNVQLITATTAADRASWQLTVLDTLPAAISDPELGIVALENFKTFYSTDFKNITPDDEQWLESIYNRVSSLFSKLPAEFTGDPDEVRTNLYNAILSEPKLPIKAVHDLTITELSKYIAPQPPVLPTGMTTADVRSIMTDLEFDPETQKQLEDMRTFVKERKQDYIEQSAYLSMLREGIVNATDPELSAWQWTKMLAVQPAMATFELMDKYYNLLPRPLAAWAITHSALLKPYSSTAELNELYAQYRELGEGSWQAYSKAFEEWGTNTWLKMGIETFTDPTTYIGWGLATRIAKPVPYLGKFIGATERGWNEAWDLPFKGLRQMIRKIPQTPTQRAFSYGRQAFMDSRAYIRRYTGKDLSRVTLPEIQEAFQSAIQAATEKPMEVGELNVRVGRYLTEFDYLTDDILKDWVKGLRITPPEAMRPPSKFSEYQGKFWKEEELWSRISPSGPQQPSGAVRLDLAGNKRYVEVSEAEFRAGQAAERAQTGVTAPVVGGEGVQITPKMLHNVNVAFADFYRTGTASKQVAARESATRILASMGVDASEANVAKMVNRLNRHSEQIVSAALDGVKGDTAHDVLSGILREVEDREIRKALSPVYDYAMKSGRATSWVQRAARLTDRITRGSRMVWLERNIVAPMANQYLLFTNYGPFNVIENAMRSFMGGGELLYPRASSPVDELVRFGEGLPNLPYEFIIAQREMGRLEIAVVDPVTNKTVVFSKGKLPFITWEVELPSGVKKWLGEKEYDLKFATFSKEGVAIRIGNRDYPLRSWQNWSDIGGDMGTRQRANYLLTKNRQFLAELAPEQIQQIADVFSKHEAELSGLASFSKGDIADILRTLENDAVVGPDMVRRHAVPLPEFERRKAHREINKVLDRMDNVYSPQKQAIRDKVWDGSMWKDIDGTVAAIKQSIREFNIVGLVHETEVLNGLVADIANYIPKDSADLVQNLGFVSDLTDGISKRISEVRSITRARARALRGLEKDDFYLASSQVLADFIQTSKDSVDKITANIKEVARSVGRVDMSQITLDTALQPHSARIAAMLEKLPAEFKYNIKEIRLVPDPKVRARYIPGAKQINISTLDDVNEATFFHELGHSHIDELYEADRYKEANQLLIQYNEAATDLSSGLRLTGRQRSGLAATRYSTSSYAKYRQVHEGFSDDFAKWLENPNNPAVPSDVRELFAATYPKKSMPPLTEAQITNLDALTAAINLRHASTLAYRNQDRQLINAAIAKTPRNKRQEAFWDWLDAKRETDIYIPMKKADAEFENQIEDLKLGIMRNFGVDISDPLPIPDVPDKLTPAHLAYLFRTTGDDLNRALTKAGAMVTIRPKDEFINWVYRRANRASTKLGKSADQIGFTKQAIGDVYDQMFLNLGIDPVTAADPMAPAMLQMDEVGQELHRLLDARGMPENEYIQFKNYLNGVADDLEQLPMFKPPILAGGDVKGAAPAMFWYFGGKRELAPQILPQLGYVSGNIIDPFFGTGAIPFGLKRSGNLGGRIVAQEANSDIVRLYRVAKENPAELKAAVKALYIQSGGVIDKPRATAIRDEFNVGVGSEIDQAARWIVISRHSERGLIAYNKAGEILSTMQEVNPHFSGKWTPASESRIFEGIDAAAWADVRQATADSYINAIRSAGPGDVVYLDPPYLGRYNAYPGETTVGAWTEAKLDIMLAEASAAAGRGARVVVSESLQAEPLLTKHGFTTTHIQAPKGRGLKGAVIAPELLATKGAAPVAVSPAPRVAAPTVARGKTPIEVEAELRQLQAQYPGEELWFHGGRSGIETPFTYGSLTNDPSKVYSYTKKRGTVYVFRRPGLVSREGRVDIMDFPPKAVLGEVPGISPIARVETFGAVPSVAAPTVAGGPPLSQGQQDWLSTREQAMTKAREEYEMDFTDYEHHNMVDAAMRTVFPFWTYESQRWFWLPRAMLKRPGVGTAIGRYMDYSQDGYIPIPGTDIQFNPLRGSVFMGGFKRMMLKDYPEYYDSFPGMKIIDYISRLGFYPGVHVMLPIIATGASTGKPEWGEVLPAWAKSGLDSARAIAPEQAGKVLDHLFPDRFRDYLTMLTLGEQGYDADTIWRKKASGQKLTEDEQRLWLRAEAKATGLKGVLFEQGGVFRLRPQEYTQMQQEMKDLLAELTGVPVSVQDEIQRQYPTTGKRFSDYYKLDALQQKILYEQESYQRWQGVTTPLLPSSIQREEVDIRNYYERADQLYTDYRKTGVYDEQGTLISPSLNAITAQWIDGQISPDQWVSARGKLLSDAAVAVREMGKRDFPDVPKTLAEREERLAKLGIPAPTYSPDQELLYLYYDIKPELTYNWESGRDEYDFDTYYAKVDIIIETLQGEYRQRLLDRIQYDWNDMEKLYWNTSREFLRPYRMVKSLVMEQLSPDQRQAIRRFEVARGAEREALQQLPGPEGQKLISWFTSTTRTTRQRLRMLDSELDAWTYFFGVTDTLLSAQSKALYQQYTKQFMNPTMSGATK